jgi:hypothetical protein
LLGSYRFSDLISASFGVANTWSPTINDRSFFYGEAESQKTYMGSLALTAPDSMGFLAGSTLYGGIVNGFDSQNTGENMTSYYVGATMATPVTGLRMGAAFDLLNVHNTDGETWTVAGYASYQATEKLSFHARGEYLRDRGDQKLFNFPATPGDYNGFYAPDKTLGVTATAQYDLWQNVISRVELRWDHSLTGDPAFGETGDMINAWMLAGNIVYKF